MVDQGGVGLMPDRRNQRDHRCRGGTHHNLLVERHQVFEAAAAPRDDQQIRSRHAVVPWPAGEQAVEPSDCRRHLRRRPLALHRHRPEQDPAREAVGEAVQDVADHRAGRRSDDADHLGQERQLLLALGVEQPFGGESLSPFFEDPQQCADAGELDRVDDQLVFGAARIGGQAAGAHHLHAVLGL